MKKLLIANRGEIAIRIARAARDYGVSPVAIYADADIGALHAAMADEAYGLGPGRPAGTYLNIEKIIAIAERCGADAIHPGYGFLSENAAFAEICGSCGITFIGPTVRNMRVMGDKARARRAADKAGVPTIPGDSKGLLDVDEALKVAERAGFPVLLKACAGGGGRGMKIVQGPEEFASLFSTAQREVEAAFGDGHLLVEKYLPRVRHVEVQLAGDHFHNIIHLGVRDCSIQRRYQKVIEESPSPGLPPEVQAQIQNAAVEVAKSVNYTNVGTVEFLVDLNTMKFYFIEMNTRLQVEHPVTEMATDTDLVKEQIRLAAGMELSIAQDDVVITGHTMEARINAEDPRRLIPSPGLIQSYHPPGGHGVRVDSALYSGYTVQPYYDSLVSKLIVRARDRASCIQKLLVALDEYIIEGINTNIELHRRILRHPDFQNGNFYTKFLEHVPMFPKDEGCADTGSKAGASA